MKVQNRDQGRMNLENCELDFKIQHKMPKKHTYPE